VGIAQGPHRADAPRASSGARPAFSLSKIAHRPRRALQQSWSSEESVIVLVFILIFNFFAGFYTGYLRGFFT